MSNTFKILANSLFGVAMTRCEEDFKIALNEQQVDQKVRKPNFNSRNIINDDLVILEMENISYLFISYFNRQYHFTKQ